MLIKIFEPEEETGKIRLMISIDHCFPSNTIDCCVATSKVNIGPWKGHVSLTTFMPNT